MLKLKKLDNDYILSCYNKAIKESEEVANREFNLRCDLAKKIRKEVEEVKKESNYQYIIRLEDLNLYYLEGSSYIKERKEELMLQNLKHFVPYDIRPYNISNIVEHYNIYFSKLEQKSNKIKYNGSILDRWGDLTPNTVYLFFKFLNNCLETEINIPEWNYLFWNQFREFGKIYNLNDKISFKVFKNGKIEIWEV